MDFIWDGALNGNVNPQALAQLQEVNGISFRGCNFQNATPQIWPYSALGIGILSRESQFYVIPECNSITQVGQPCPSQTKSEFKDLRFGIYASNANALSFTCKESEFVNNQFGIYVRGTHMEKITENNFAIRESDLYQSAGLAMYSSSGYKVEANEFHEFDDVNITNGTSLAYGIVVNNSGEVDNRIYRNIFHNLKIGGQSEGVNAKEITSTNAPNNANGFEMIGLKWACNDFQSDITDHDLTVRNGRIDYHQGYPTGFQSELEAKRQAARNKFSLKGDHRHWNMIYKLI